MIRPRTRSPRRAMRYPMASEVAYRKAIRGVLAALRRELRAGLETTGPAMLAQAAMYRPDDDGPVPEPTGWASLLRAMLERVVTLIAGDLRTAEATIGRLSREVADFNLSEWRGLVREAYGVDILRSEPWLADQLSAWEQANLSLIRSVPSQVVEQVRQQITRKVTEGTTLRDLEATIRERLSVGESRAELIARDQTAKLNADLTQRRQQSAGVLQYQWITMGDERVRPTHRDNSGKIFSWSKPPAATGHPAHDIRCRCFAAPIFPEMTETEVRLLGS